METLSVGVHLAGKYQVQEVLEARSWCIRYLARDSVYNKSWVVKQFEIPEDADQKREFLNHFYAEGERESEISSEHLPRVEEFFAEKGCAWTVTEVIAGKSLADLVQEAAGPLSEEQVRGWMTSLAEAIRLLHGQEPRMVLGGFDREEFMVTAEGQLRLRDYGMARIYPPARRADIPPEGLPRWYDSEMLRNAKATRQADIWSLGALGYYLLTGVDAAHDGRKPLATLRPDLSAPFSALVERCLEPFGDRVYSAIEEVIDDLTGRSTAQQQPERSLPPHLNVVPTRLDFAGVTPGAVTVERFRIVNEGGGTLAGHVHSTVPWLQVSPQHFEGNDQEIQVWVDTAVLHEDVSARGDILVTSTNEELRLPVTVQLELGKVGGLSPRVGAVLMVLVACVPLGLLGWFDVQAIRAVSEYLAGHGDAVSRLTSTEKPADMLELRTSGMFVLLARFVLAVGIPGLVYLVWNSLGAGAKRRTTAVALVGMVLPALFVLVSMRAAEGGVGGSAFAMWALVAPALGGWWCILATILTTWMLMTPGERYPLFFGQSPGLRILLAVVLVGFYGYQAWGILSAGP